MISHLVRLGGVIKQVPIQAQEPFLRLMDSPEDWVNVDMVKPLLQAGIDKFGLLNRWQQATPQLRCALEGVMVGYFGKVHLAAALLELGHALRWESRTSSTTWNHFDAHVPSLKMAKLIYRVHGRNRGQKEWEVYDRTLAELRRPTRHYRVA